mgnify:CR=1 FL=1
MIRHTKLKETAAASSLRSDDTIFLTISSSAMINKPGREAFLSASMPEEEIVRTLLEKPYLSCTSLAIDMRVNSGYPLGEYLTYGCYPFMTTMMLYCRNDCVQ